jgi:hypothetical protein
VSLLVTFVVVFAITMAGWAWRQRRDKGGGMTHPKRRPQGRDDYLRFLRSSPILGVALAVLVMCAIAGVIIEVATNSLAADLVGYILILLSGILLLAVSVRFQQWERARP